MTISESPKCAPLATLTISAGFDDTLLLFFVLKTHTNVQKTSEPENDLDRPFAHLSVCFFFLYSLLK